jgi:hypothetical protein
VSSLDRASDPINPFATPLDAPVGVVEHAILSKDLVDGRASAHGVIFTEDVVKIPDQ